MAGSFGFQSMAFIFKATAMEPHCRNTTLTSSTPLAVCQCLNSFVGWKRKYFVVFRVTLFSTTASRIAEPSSVFNGLEGERLISILIMKQQCPVANCKSIIEVIFRK